jgi:uncharacterized protein (TIGR02646 family)
MREISSQVEPVKFTQWRSGSRDDINYGYNLMPTELRAELKDALITEQRSLCAYTGIGIDASRSHIEHLLPQSHCRRGQEDVAYKNMVACYPAPDSGYVPFGALLKANWPSLAEQYLFVSPRSAGCERRFMFNLRGEITVAENDEAAGETVVRLGLNHKRITALRKEAINATLELWGRKPPMLDLRSARKRLTCLEDAENAGGQLEPFCFALKQALRKHILRLESIRDSKTGRPRM